MAVPPAPVQVPSQRPLSQSVTSVANDKGGRSKQYILELLRILYKRTTYTSCVGKTHEYAYFKRIFYPGNSTLNLLLCMQAANHNTIQNKLKYFSCMCYDSPYISDQQISLPSIPNWQTTNSYKFIWVSYIISQLIAFNKAMKMKSTFKSTMCNRFT